MNTMFDIYAPDPSFDFSKGAPRASCALVLKQGYILGLRRGPRQNLSGQWEFPSTLVQPGETSEQAIVRLMRGLGVEVYIQKLLLETAFRVSGRPISLQVYDTVWQSGKLAKEIHDTSAWFGVRALDLAQWVTHSRDLVNLLQRAADHVENETAPNPSS